MKSIINTYVNLKVVYAAITLIFTLHFILQTSIYSQDNVPEKNINSEKNVITKTPAAPKKQVPAKKNKTAPRNKAAKKQPVKKKHKVVKKHVSPQKHITTPKRIVPQNKMIPKSNIIPGKNVTPTNIKLPENNTVPEKNIAPEETTEPEIDKTPENTIELEKNIVPEEKITPQTNQAPENNTAPEKIIAPEETTEPEIDKTQKNDIVPEKDIVPEEKAASQTHQAPEKNIVPEKIDEPEKAAAKYLTGDWGGFRQKVVDKGANFETVYTAESDFNAVGGLSQGYAVLGNLDVTLDMDMEKLLGWTGGEIFIYGLGGHGQPPSALVGDLQATSNIETGMNYFKLYQVWAQQSLFDGKIAFLLGLHDLNSECYVTRTSSLLLNSSFGVGADLAQSGENGPSIFPSAALAAKLKIEPVEHFYINLGSYNAIAGDPTKPWATAVDITFKSGLLLIGEIGYDVEDNIKISGGSWVYTKSMTDFSGGNSAGFGAYVMFDKNIGKNFSFFIRGGFANPAVYQMAYNISEGIKLSGALWTREDDELGFGVTTVINASAFQELMNAAGTPVDTHETAIELTYKIQATPWVSLQPDFQYVVNPGTNPEIADAFVIALRSRVSF